MRRLVAIATLFAAFTAFHIEPASAADAPGCTLTLSTFRTSGCTVVASDAGGQADPAPLWGRIDCQSSTRARQYTAGGDRYPTGTGQGQGNDAHRLLTVFDGDNVYGERCELGRNEHRYGEEGGSGTFALYGEGQHRVTFLSIRLPYWFPLNASTSTQAVLQMRQTQPSDNGGGTPALFLEATNGSWRLYQSDSTGPSSQSHQLWATPAQLTRWTRIAFDVTYSQDPTKGSVKVYIDLNGDGDALDAGEQSPQFTTYTLKRETATSSADEVASDGIAPGASIPSHLRVGIDHDSSYACPTPDGCAIKLDNVQVVEAGIPDPPPPASWDGCEWGTFSSINYPNDCWRPYANWGPFNTPVPADPPLASNSPQIVQKLMSFSTTPANNFGGVADTSKDWMHPIYYSRPTDPLFTIHLRSTWGSSPAIEGMQIRIPDAARPAGGDDAVLTVIDQTSGWEYGFYDVTQKPSGGGTLVAYSGGRTRIDGDGLGVDCATAYFGCAAGVIRPAELAAGQINHALFMGVYCTDDAKVYPADPRHGKGRYCSSAGLSDANAPHIGSHFYLDMSDAQINALAAPAWKKTILRAMADYGMYVGNTGGAGWAIKVESGSSFTSFGYKDPWLTLGEEYGVPTWYDSSIGRTTRVFKLGNVVDWGSKLKVLAP